MTPHRQLENAQLDKKIPVPYSQALDFPAILCVYLFLTIASQATATGHTSRMGGIIVRLAGNARAGQAQTLDQRMQRGFQGQR